MNKRILISLLIALFLIFVVALSSCGNTSDENDTDSDATDGLEYKLKDDDTYEVIGIGTATETDIVIPSTYNGKAVTSIGDMAFENCKDLISINIPNSITSIGKCAFIDCNSLNAVYIKDLSSWCKIEFGDLLATPLTYAENLYLNNELVTELVIPSDITEIKAYTFSQYSALTSVTLHNNITSIGNCAFAYCDDLTDITIPQSVTHIGANAFGYCEKLKSVTFENTSGWYVSAYEDETSAVGNEIDLLSPSVAADNLTFKYAWFFWYRK